MKNVFIYVPTPHLESYNVILFQLWHAALQMWGSGLNFF